MGGGAWPFSVGGAICLVNSVNERDPRLLNRIMYPRGQRYFLRRLRASKCEEARGNNRSVMPLDVLGCTRATLIRAPSAYPYPLGIGNLSKTYRGGDRLLQLPFLN